MAGSESLVLFDGFCNLCCGTGRFIIRHDKKRRFRFASLQSESAQKILGGIYPERGNNFPSGNLRTIILLENGKIYLKSRAVLRIARQLDGILKASVLLYIIPSFLADLVYDLVTKYRYRIFGKRDSCMAGDEVR